VSERRSDRGPHRAAYYEIQVHTSDLRRGVHYLFLSRRQVQAVGLALALLVGFLAFGLAILPRVFRDGLQYRAYGGFSVERSAEGRKLKELVTAFTAEAERGASLRRQAEKISLVYGLYPNPSSGQGGFPLSPPAPPDSIYASTVLKVSTLESELREQLQVVDTFLEEASAFERANRERVQMTPSLCPLRGRDFVLTSPFGQRRNPFTKAIDFHAGLDLAAATGTPILAPAAGTVVFAGRYPLRQSVGWWRYGSMVMLRHGDDFVTIFGHCQTVGVKTGQRVRPGDPIATVGNTGWSTSPHLHYEIRRRQDDGKFLPVDPRIYVLDHTWSDEDQLLVRRREAPDMRFEPLPSIVTR
jgi:murein DD-endopeptidase MepM/ murein hydrolase activator NlpD